MDSQCCSFSKRIIYTCVDARAGNEFMLDGVADKNLELVDTPEQQQIHQDLRLLNSGYYIAYDDMSGFLLVRHVVLRVKNNMAYLLSDLYFPNKVLKLCYNEVQDSFFFISFRYILRYPISRFSHILTTFYIVLAKTFTSIVFVYD